MNQQVILAEGAGVVGAINVGVVIGHVVHEDGTPSLEEVRFRLQGYAATTTGRVVAVEVEPVPDTLERVFLMLRVNGVREVNPHETPEGATVREVIPHTDQVLPRGAVDGDLSAG